ncbi:uncharacterized protein LOC124137817 [Haliotis rufescens]|uniref:uncharacterized protein LOC124137817 n=1 Tax=Haliotis rufescens TaxID=6454 RepID=UPI00201E83F8|nr:uncharacterized protein LOC124137817 [Haliotis rufescens]
MASDEDVTKLDLIGQTQEKQGLFSQFKERLKTILGLPTQRKDPNVDVKVLHSAERDECLDQLGLHQDQLLVSDVYRVVQSLQTLPPDGELIVPLEMPERSIPPQVLYTFTYCMKIGGQWHLEPAEYKEGGCVYGKLTEMDVFCVTAELKPEYATVGPKGHKFVSEKDERIAIDFPEDSLKKETKLKIVTDIVDQQRFEEYKRDNEKFRCIVGFTNILTVHPPMKLHTEANIRLPLDGDFVKGHGRVMFLHWKKNDDADDDEDEDDVTVVNVSPMKQGGNSYTIPVKSFSGYCCVAVQPHSPIREIVRAAKHAIGKLNLCVLLTFLDYDQHLRVNYILVDCVEFTKVDRAVELHTNDGMTEIKHSRSRDIELRDRTKIKLALGGCIKLHDKAFATNSFYFNQMSRTNKVVIPFTSTGEDGSLRFYWGQHDHKVHFPLEWKKAANKKPSTRQRPAKKNQRSMSAIGHRGTEVSSRERKYSQTQEPSIEASIPRKPSVIAKHPLLTDKSLAALADTLPYSEWRNVGLELNFPTDAITTIFDRADKIRSNPGLELLTEWRRRNTERDTDKLMDDLTDAFSELKRNDIAEVVAAARQQVRPIRRSDLDCILASPRSPMSPMSTFGSEVSFTSDETDSVFQSGRWSSASNQNPFLSGVTQHDSGQ